MMKWTEVIQISKTGNPNPPEKIVKSKEEWQKILTPEQFHITREHGTEAPFSSEMCSIFTPGIYKCVCCETVLFDANEKFESGSGWPSFTQPLESNVISYHLDHSYGRERVEVRCNVCDAHLGHVFQDGPPPTGLRYCINALAIKK